MTSGWWPPPTVGAAPRRVVRGPAVRTVSTVVGVAGSQNNVLGPLPGGLNAPRGIAVLGANTLAATTQHLVLKLVPR